MIKTEEGIKHEYFVNLFIPKHSETGIELNDNEL